MNNFPKQIVSNKQNGFNYFGAIVTIYFLFLCSHYWGSIYEDKLGQLLIRHVAYKIFFTLLFPILLGSVLSETLWEQSITIW